MPRVKSEKTAETKTSRARKPKTVNTIKNSEPKVRKPRTKKVKPEVKTFTDDGMFFEAKCLVFRILDDNGEKNILKEFANPVTIGKNKIGKMTKMADGNWAEIMDIITTEQHLTFVVNPIV